MNRMNRIKMFMAKKFFKELLPVSGKQFDASGSSGGGAGRELASESVKRIVYKENSETDFEDPDFDLSDIQNGYNTDSYIRQGVDKYVDQIFKEGYSFYGTDTNVVDYLKLRLSYIAEATQQMKSVSVTENGTQIINPDSGKSGLTAVQLSVDVAGGGGTGVQPDYAQNNSTAADYIKNRPGGYMVETPSISKTMTSADYRSDDPNSDGRYKFSDIALPDEAILNATGKVKIVANDGTETEHDIDSIVFADEQATIRIYTVSIVGSADTLNIISGIAKVLFQYIFHNIASQIADMSIMIYCRSTSIHSYFIFIIWNKFLYFMSKCIVYFK